MQSASFWFVAEHGVTDSGLRKLSFGRGTKLISETSESNFFCFSLPVTKMVSFKLFSLHLDFMPQKLSIKS